jgi:hypothetical protein
MSVHMQEIPSSGHIEIELSGKLTKEDYAAFVPAIDSAISQRGKVRLLVVMRDFHGWTAGALWEDVKFDWKHYSDIEQLAIVGEKKWEAGMAHFCRPFTRARIKYFDVSDIDAARGWITAETVTPAAT